MPLGVPEILFSKTVKKPWQLWSKQTVQSSRNQPKAYNNLEGFFLKWLNISNNRLLTPFIFPGSHLPLFNSVAALKSACNCGDSQQPSSCRMGQKRVGALSRLHSQRIVIIWPILQFLRNPSRKTCLYLTWLGAHPCEKPSPQGHLSKPIRSNCLIAQLPEAAAKAGTNLKLSTKREWKKHE